MARILSPYRNAVKRHVVKSLMEKHSYSKSEARAAFAKISDDQLHQQSTMCGANLSGFDMSTIIEWIKNNWATILKVAMSIVGLILMFVEQPPQATNLPSGNSGTNPPKSGTEGNNAPTV